MVTNGYFQLFPINADTGIEGSSIFNAFSGSSGSQNVYTPTFQIIMFRTANISESYSLTIVKM